MKELDEKLSAIWESPGFAEISGKYDKKDESEINSNSSIGDDNGGDTN